MKLMSAEKFVVWDADIRETRLSLLEPSNVLERFVCKLFCTLTRRHCISLSMTTQRRTRKQFTPMKCQLIGELKMLIRNTDGLTTLRKNGLLATFTPMASRASGACSSVRLSVPIIR